MTPAKKKAAVKRKPCPPPAAPASPAPPPPAPILTAPQRRFFKVIPTKNVIGGIMFLLGVGFCVGFWFSDKVHDIEKVVLGIGVFFIIAGAHFMSSEPTERFLKAAVGAVKGSRGKSEPTGGD